MLKIKIFAAFTGWTLLVLQVCNGKHANAIFRVEKENSAIENVQPFHEKNVTTELQCFFTARYQPKPVCFLQTIFIADLNSWRCQLFESINRTTFRISQRIHSKLYASENDFCLLGPVLRRDCLDWYNYGFATDGVYKIKVKNTEKDIYCDMTRDSGGWTVIQKRFDGSVSFKRTWQEYKDGFGNISGEYWLGNEYINHLTEKTDSELRIFGERFSGKQKQVIARGFFIENENKKYRVHSGTKISGDGTLFRSWLFTNLQKFSTKGADNDPVSKNCAKDHGGGWWFKNCQRMNFNGPYVHKEDLDVPRVGIVWYEWIGQYKSLKSVEMAVKRTK